MLGANAAGVGQMEDSGPSPFALRTEQDGLRDAARSLDLNVLIRPNGILLAPANFR